ncbi:hypothetical protein PAL_GLEAN10017753 [Pteropus alecto]|uniref:Uncharacterized protein n=1 Tax=Pteropus alecto TaxID=9402 RepID=L5KXP7_PTEAL|nr:hypothetical protein PAL_GLEAN10017753 [Pteropus alecto]
MCSTGSVFLAHSDSEGALNLREWAGRRLSLEAAARSHVCKLQRLRMQDPWGERAPLASIQRRSSDKPPWQLLDNFEGAPKTNAGIKVRKKPKRAL